MAREVLIIQTGTANTASVMAGLTRAGADAVLSNDPGLVERAERVVLPGVGAMAAALRRLEQDGLVEAIRNRIASGRPTLAICLGLQLLCNRSEESPDTEGLGVIPTLVRRFPDSVSVPQMGWNRIEPDQECRYLQPGFAYFANSFRVVEAPAAWSAAWSAAWADHGGRFLAAAEQGDIVACQFHPELSGAWGQDLLARWIEGGSSC